MTAAPERIVDWADLPKDLYVISAQRIDPIVIDVQMCNVPMVIGPECRYVRADLPALSAAAMKRLAVHEVRVGQIEMIERGYIEELSDVFDQVVECIEAIPDPTPADLLREALALPEIAALVDQLKEVSAKIANSDHWWMDCPDKGGFDLDAINAALANLKGEA